MAMARLTVFGVLKIASSLASGSSAGFQLAFVASQSALPPIQMIGAAWAAAESPRLMATHAKAGARLAWRWMRRFQPRRPADASLKRSRVRHTRHPFATERRAEISLRNPIVRITDQ